ncbi:MAG: UMP kinase [SAR202 cluster bacterium]|nr:UMP kinase [SAR202 cluster bacterium]|tara:strand:- start:583 stop:1317 length:735 start_codon:yes stop_codon:yes gene_type:complete
MDQPEYSRVILKMSGESFKGERDFGMDAATLKFISCQIKSIVDLGVEVGVVVGGGNIWRGADYEQTGMDRSTADSAGMLATIMNALALQDALESVGVTVRTQSAIAMPSVAEPYIRRRAIRHLQKGRVVIFAGGTGNPYMTTDTAAALRALEIGANVLVMAKNGIDGVYDSDPRRNVAAKKYENLSHHQALSQRLEALDSTALSLCMDNSLPIVVFDIFKSGNLALIITGEHVGTLIHDGVTSA